ncbi:MAG: GNAT family N-acetyltransferase [Betaproteobacteria bacterium]|nr:GNAT family N-acetyltransferase [Betaproteobacteria bacterium]
MNVLAVTDAKGRITDPELLAAAEPVHRQLRPDLSADYAGRMREVFASGAEMAVAVTRGKVVGVTVFRVIEKTHSGRELYCDDLVTDETNRSKGAGRAMIAFMERIGRERGCDLFALDSGCQRQQAHKFYFREGLVVGSFHFSKKIT